MTQHFIRKLAGYGPIQRAIMRLHEPRIVSAIYGAVYLLVFVVAVYNFIDPPRTIAEAANNPWLLWASLTGMATGGALGVVTVGAGTYWLERYAATLVTAGLGIYWLISVWLTIFSGGSRWMSLLTTTMAVTLVALRFYWVLDRPYHPNRRT